MEAIKCAAIKYKLLIEPDIFKYVTGANHGECIDCFSCMDIPRSDRDLAAEVQGFMTSAGRFVDRLEAYEIAKNAGQLIREAYNCKLDSYNCRYNV